MTDFKLLALQIGDEIKNNITVEEINRIAGAIFDFERLEFPSDITSGQARSVYDWVMTLEKQPVLEEQKLYLLKRFQEQLFLKMLMQGF